MAFQPLIMPLRRAVRRGFPSATNVEGVLVYRYIVLVSFMSQHPISTQAHPHPPRLLRGAQGEEESAPPTTNPVAALRQRPGTALGFTGLLKVGDLEVEVLPSTQSLELILPASTACADCQKVGRNSFLRPACKTPTPSPIPSSPPSPTI